MMGREKYGRGEKQHLVVHVDNEPQQTAKATQEFLKGKETEYSSETSLPDLCQTQHAFKCLNTKLNEVL